VSGDVEELAASTNNPKYAAKMLGYDQNTFGDMLHNFKPTTALGRRITLSGMTTATSISMETSLPTSTIGPTDRIAND
jgi:hypothetical protein